MAKKKAKPKKNPARRFKGYSASGTQLTRKNKNCPKCGPGIILSSHKDRLYCGSCHYAEFLKKQ